MQRKNFCRVISTVVLLLFTACQPTPYQAAVEPSESDMVQPHSLYQLKGLPESIQIETVVLGCGSVAVQAAVQATTVAAYPVFAVYRAPFSQEQLLELVESICPNAVLHEPWEQTKQELVEEREAMEQLEQMTEEDEIYLNWIDKELETAPFTASKTPFDWESVPETGYVSAYVQTDNDVTSGVQLGSYTFSFFRDINLSGYPASFFTQSEKTYLFEPTVSREAALLEAQTMLSQLGILNMALLEEQTELSAFCKQNRVQETGYQFVFVPALDGLPGVWDASVVARKDALPTIAAPWRAEVVRIMVSSHGVEQLLWSDPSTCGKVLESDVTFLPLQTVAERAQQQLLYMFAAVPGMETSASDGVLQQVTVTDIVLVRGCIQLPNETERGQSVPLWRFSYTYRWKDRTEPEYGTIYLTAEDGKYVEPRLTMQDIMELTG